ncbi:hypothetical protein [Pseudomonas sp. TTU2014-080ASC]|uniref:hypothetical protein n=1 Tax=Pseudomonas sp. TTU2014-080ASC TaxID=1729724 RepID=UPI000AF8D37A|nr:hypothetical protein [Pseudomonas sp. TTU2014-080ASC]
MFKESILLIWRSHLIALGGLLVALVAISAFCAGLFSGRQPATVALDVGISTLRLFTPLLLFLLVHEVMSREFSRKYYLRTFAMPINRANILFGKFFAVFLYMVFLVVLGAALLGGMAYFVSLGYQQATAISMSGFAIFIAFFLLDVFVILSVSVFVSMITSSTGFLFFTIIGFSIVSRTYYSVIQLLADGAPLESGISMLKWLVPDLGSLDIRGVALYGKIEFLPDQWALLIAGTLGYAVLFLAFAVMALQNKRFS